MNPQILQHIWKKLPKFNLDHRISVGQSIIKDWYFMKYALRNKISYHCSEDYLVLHTICIWTQNSNRLDIHT